MRRRTGLWIACAAPLLTAPAALAAPVLHVEAGGRAARATPGVACVQVAEEDGTPRGRCSGRRYPLRTSGRAVLRGGERVQLRFSRGPGQVKWRLLRRSDARPVTLLAGDAHRSPRRRGRFAFTLPRRVPCGTVLDVYATYGRGAGRHDQVWWAGVRVARPACERRR